MQPDPNLQLTVVIKALRDVVLPSLDSENAVALEQLHLSLATLEMVRSRLPMLHAVARRELKNAVTLARAVNDDAAVGSMIAAAVTLLEDPAAGTDAIDTLRAGLLDEVSKSVNRTVNRHQRRTVARSVIAASKAQCDLARAWSVPSGFERDPEELQELTSLI